MAPKQRRRAKRKPKPHPETCERCPHRFCERGCPFWVRAELAILEENIVSGENRVFVGCIFYDGYIARWLSHTIAACNRPAAAIESCRNEISAGLDKVAKKLSGALVPLVRRLSALPAMAALEAPQPEAEDTAQETSTCQQP